MNCSIFKRRAQLILGIVAINFVLGTTGSAQVRQGLSELNLSGSLGMASRGGQSTTIIQLAMSYGHFVVSFLELGGNFSFASIGGTAVSIDYGAFLSAHLPGLFDESVVPYIGGQIEFDFDNPSTYGGFVGLKVFVSEGGGAVSVQGYYSRQTFVGLQVDNYGVLTGVSVFY